MCNNLIDDLKSKKIIDFKPSECILKEKSNDPIVISSSKGEMIDDENYIKAKFMGNHMELCYIRTVPTEMPIERIDENTYLIKSTNQTRQYKKSKTRDEQVKSLKRTFRKLRELINTNFHGLPNEKFVTLTYKKKQRDHEQVYTDFKVWIKAVRKKYGSCDYINVVEPQASGSWHCHVLIKFYELPNNYLDYNEFRKLWKHGVFVNVRDLTDCDNIGAYLSAYLTDIELTDKTLKKAQKEMGVLGANEKIVEKIVDGEKKSFIKGGRMSYYPNKMNLYRRSRGIKDPFVAVGKKGDLILDNYEFERSNKMELKKGNETVNTIHYESYVKKGHKKNLNELAVQ